MKHKFTTRALCLQENSYIQTTHTILSIPDRLIRKKFRRTAVSQENELPTWFSSWEKGTRRGPFPAYVLLTRKSDTSSLVLILYSTVASSGFNVVVFFWGQWLFCVYLFDKVYWSMIALFITNLMSFSWLFPLCASLFFFSNTSQGLILYFLTLLG